MFRRMTAQAIRSVLFASDRGSARGGSPNSDPRSILPQRRGALFDEAPQRRRQGLQHRRKERRLLHVGDRIKFLGKAPRHRVLICMKAGSGRAPGSSRTCGRLERVTDGSIARSNVSARIQMGASMGARCTPDLFDLAPDEGPVARRFLFAEFFLI